MAISPTIVFDITLKRRLDDDRLKTKKQCVEGPKAMKGPFYYLNNGKKPDENVQIRIAMWMMIAFGCKTSHDSVTRDLGRYIGSGMFTKHNISCHTFH